MQGILVFCKQNDITWGYFTVASKWSTVKTITIIQIILDFPKEHWTNSHGIGSSSIKTK